MSLTLWICQGEAGSTGALLDGLMLAASANLVRRVLGRGRGPGARCIRGSRMGGAGRVVEAGGILRRHRRRPATAAPMDDPSLGDAPSVPSWKGPQFLISSHISFAVSCSPPPEPDGPIAKDGFVS